MTPGLTIRIFHFLLLFSLIACAPCASAAENQPANADPCQSGTWEYTLDEHGYEVDLCYKDFAFYNYRYEFSLPEKRLGFPYPNNWATHGVVFPLGTLLRNEEKRDLLVWAFFDLDEDQERDRIPVDEQLRDRLQLHSERIPNATANAVFFPKSHGGVEFVCFSTSDKGLFQHECMGVHESIMYEFSLSSTDKHRQEDLEYFNKVIQTFVIIPEGQQPEEHPLENWLFFVNSYARWFFSAFLPVFTLP